MLFTGVSVGVSADILTMLLAQRLRENVFPIDVVCLLLWSHMGETPIQKSPPVMDWSQTRVNAFDATAVFRSEGNDGTTAKIIYILYLSPHKCVEFVEMLT